MGGVCQMIVCHFPFFAVKGFSLLVLDHFLCKLFKTICFLVPEIRMDFTACALLCIYTFHRITDTKISLSLKGPRRITKLICHISKDLDFKYFRGEPWMWLSLLLSNAENFALWTEEIFKKFCCECSLHLTWIFQSHNTEISSCTVHPGQPGNSTVFVKNLE